MVRQDIAVFRRALAGRTEEDHRAVERAVYAHVEEFVLVLVDQRRGLLAQGVAVDLVGAFGVVLGDVEERQVVGGPGDAGDLADGRLDFLAGGEVLQVEVVVAVAVHVGGVSEHRVIVAVVKIAQRHEFLPRRELVHVEDDFLRRVHAAFLAAEDGVLLAFLGAGVEPVTPLRVGRGRVGLLGAAEHLGVELVFEAFEGGHHRGGVGVLGLEVFEDGGVLLFAQPEIGVLDFVAVQADDLGLLVGDGRFGGVGIEHERVGAGGGVGRGNVDGGQGSGHQERQENGGGNGEGGTRWAAWVHKGGESVCRESGVGKTTLQPPAFFSVALRASASLCYK